MNHSITPQALLEQILNIRRMEHGSLSVIGHGPNGPYYNLNSWEDGTNQCRYIPQDKVPEVQQAIPGCQQYQQLTQEYGKQIVEQTRAQLGIGVKKSPAPIPRAPTPSPLRPRPGNPAVDDPFPHDRPRPTRRSGIGIRSAAAHGRLQIDQRTNAASVPKAGRSERCRLPAQSGLSAQGPRGGHPRVPLRVFQTGA